MRYQKRLVIQNVPVKQELFGTLIVLWAPEQSLAGAVRGSIGLQLSEAVAWTGAMGTGRPYDERAGTWT
jgi:hypothetical protein